MITEKLANIIVDMEYEKIPDEVILKAKQCFTDFLAVSLRGSKLTGCEIVRDIFNNGDGSTVIGYDQADCTEAAMVNGVFAHSLDLDDGHRFSMLHPGCSVIPAALSLTEARDKSGKDLITSIVAGYQVSILMGMIANPEHRALGFHSTGTCGTFGAAAASCKAIGLKFEDTVNALGLAGTQTAGLLESDHRGSMGKHLHAGKAAQSGVIAAALAEKGFTGASSIIDGNEGFLNAMVIPDVRSMKSIEKYQNKAVKILSNHKYHIMDVYFKKYPVCRHLHSSVDAMIEVFNQMVLKEVKSEEIISINVKTYKIASEHVDYNPQTVEDIRQSLPVVMAITILNGYLDINNIEINSSIISMASKVSVECDECMEKIYPIKRPSKVTVTTKNESYTFSVDLPVGEPEYPLDQKYILEKFHKLNPIINLDVLNPINELESSNIRDLMTTLNKEFIHI